MTGRIALREEIAAILERADNRWMTTREVTDRIHRRGRSRKRDGTHVTDFQIHGRTRKRPRLFEREGRRVRLRRP